MARQILEPRAWHYIKYRSVRAKKLVKWNSSRKLVAEVYSKKTNKKVGYLNRIEAGKPVPRKFSKKAKILYHVARRTRAKKGINYEIDCFKLNFLSLFPKQIPESTVDNLNFQIERFGEIGIQLKFQGKDSTGLEISQVRPEPKKFNQTLSSSRWKDLLTTMIVGALREKQLRTSPKKYAKKNKYWKPEGKVEWRSVRKFRVCIYRVR